MKIIIQNILPPIVFNTLIMNIKKILFIFIKPRVFKIIDGPAVDNKILINNKFQTYRDIISGEYDSFLWKQEIVNTLKNQIVLDIGGHIGYHALCFSSLVGKNGKVYCFEPNPQNYGRIKDNILINNKNNITAINKAVSNVISTIKLNFTSNIEDPSSSGGFIESSQYRLDPKIAKIHGYKTTTIKTVKIDLFLSDEEKDKVKLIKIDVEGAEASVLEGSIETITKSKPHIFIEIHSIECLYDCINIMNTINYTYDKIEIDTYSRGFFIFRPNENITHSNK